MSLNRPLMLVLLATGAAVTVFEFRSADLTSPMQALAALTSSSASAADAPAAASAPPDLPSAAPHGDGALPFSFATKPAAAVPGDATAAAPVDLSALRYFAGRNDMKRVAAEIRLLRHEHPDWQPPPDLFSQTMPTLDETALWAKFAAGDLEGARAEIEKMKADNPNWRPSSDFSDKLALAEAYAALTKASDESRWQNVMDIASNNKMLLTCGYVDALWRVADALVHTQDQTRAIEVYRYVLTNCRKPEERLATAQKAVASITAPDALEALLSLGRRLPDGRDEFESVRLDRLRKSIGDAAADPAAPPVPAGLLDAFEKRAQGSGMQKDQLLLGWYAYAHKDYPRAEAWFQKANRPEPSAEAARGLVLTLRASDKLDEALTLAKASEGLGAANKKLFVELQLASLNAAKAPAPSAETISALSAAVEEDKNAAGAQNLGWLLYRTGGVPAARAWFEKSLAWGPSEEAALGLAVATRKLGDFAAYNKAVATYAATYPKVAEFQKSMLVYAYHVSPIRRRARSGGGGGGGWDANASAIAKTLELEKFDDALAMLNARQESHRADPAGLEVVRGWALYHTHHYDAAAEAFRKAGAKGLRREADQGLEQIKSDPWSRVGKWSADAWK